MGYSADTFKDQVVLVTGGRSGIGYEIAKDYLKLGAKVIICSRDENLLAKAQQELSAYGECFAKAADIREPAQLDVLMDSIATRYGKLDILVNNAGGQFPSAAENISDKGWDAVVKNNLNGTFYITKRVANRFFIPQKQGVIVTIIAVIFRGFPGMAHTAAARAGVEVLGKTLAIEWAEHNIRVNSIAPGIIDSSGQDTYPSLITQYVRSEGYKEIPLKRLGTIEDVSNAVMFLSSPLASFISGVTLHVDGAQHLNGDNLKLLQVLKMMKSNE